MTGTTFAQYRIDAELGRGGMGIVYRATDTKLDRTVALKVLPPHALSSEDDRARFQREARAAAKLQHAHIASIFEIGEAVPSDAPHGTEPRPFIAMEFVDGDSLAERIAKGPLKLEEAIRLCTQIAEALGAAHEAGVVHRDVKSGNVMLTKKGEAKVLDFGLAKTAASTQLTRQGSTLGTVAYMSPEQARGEEVDQRTDLWALGVVLYEMIAGRLPFAADYEQAALYGILNEDPEPPTAVRTGVPMELERIVVKLLAKDRDVRYQTAADLRADLRSLGLAGSGVSRRSVSAASGIAPAPARSATKWPLIAGVALLFGVALGASPMLLRPTRTDAPKPVLRLTLPMPGGTIAANPVISPDGRRVMVEKGDSVYFFDLETGGRAAIQVPALIDKRFSQDGTEVLISSFSGIYRANADGSDWAPVVQSSGLQLASWGPAGSIMRTTAGPFITITPPTGRPDTVRAPDGVRIMMPMGTMPDGSRILVGFPETTGDLQRAAVYDPASGTFADLPAGALAMTASGHVLGDRNGGVFVAAVDPGSLALLGPEIPLSYLGSGSVFDVSDTGTLAYFDIDRNDFNYRLYQSDRTGDEEFLLELSIGQFQVSPDGHRLAGWQAVGKDRSNTLVTVDLATSLATRIGVMNNERTFRWQPDGEWILGIEGEAIVRLPADRRAEPERVVDKARLGDFGFDVRASDGRLVGVQLRSGGSSRITMWDPQTDSISVLADIDRVTISPELSPDGRFVVVNAVTDDNSFEPTVIELDGGRTWSVDFGRMPKWVPSGDALYYALGDSLFTLPISTENGFRVTGRPRLERVIPSLVAAEFTSSGDLFYTTRIEDDASRDDLEHRDLHIVLNWFEELERIAPHPKAP
jgi:Tol biopolymer transport system component/predicted Ser/Thr protein kinase